MDVETLFADYLEWVNETSLTTIYAGWTAWLEATRRADRKAREECAEIAMETTVSGPAGLDAALGIGKAIIATIPEDK